MKQRAIEIIEEEGKRLCRVPLGPRAERHAEIWEKDWNFLLKLGCPGNWNHINNNYVTACAPKASGNHVLVARVLLDAGPGESVIYRDGNPLNLRRENLTLVESAKGSRRDREYLSVPRVLA